MAEVSSVRQQPTNQMYGSSHMRATVTDMSKVVNDAFSFQAEDGIRVSPVTGVQTCALPISDPLGPRIDCASARNRFWDFVDARGST